MRDDIRMRGEPHIPSASNMRNQLLQDPDPAAVPDDIRMHRQLEKPAFVIGFADDNPGYIPPGSEFRHGGYEIDEAHRDYGLAETFAPGSAEALARCAIALGTATKEG